MTPNTSLLGIPTIYGWGGCQIAEFRVKITSRLPKHL